MRPRLIAVDDWSVKAGVLSITIASMRPRLIAVDDSRALFANEFRDGLLQ